MGDGADVKSFGRYTRPEDAIGEISARLANAKHKALVVVFFREDEEDEPTVITFGDTSYSNRAMAGAILLRIAVPELEHMPSR